MELDELNEREAELLLDAMGGIVTVALIVTVLKELERLTNVDR